MIFTLSFPDGFEERPDFKPFALMRGQILPALESHRAKFEAMYSALLGRPEVDPVLLAGLTVLQMMERRPDRAAVEACLYDARWRSALGLPPDWLPFHPTTLVYFRARLAEHGCGRVALEAGLDAMRGTGYLKGHKAVRIDSTHVLGLVSAMSRLECVRETLRLSLAFLAEFGGPSAWEPWHSRYADKNPGDLRGASADTLRTTMNQAGEDARDVLAKATALGPAVAEAAPVALLRRVFDEQFESVAGGSPVQRKGATAGAVKNPHDPDAMWSTKNSIGKEGWIGYKTQICETAPEEPRQRGEPTEAVITAAVVQSADTSDHGSVGVVLKAHTANIGSKPEEVFGDAGYVSAPALKVADEQGYELTGPVGAPPNSGSRFSSDSFAVDIPGRTCVCPAKIASSECSRIAESGRKAVYFYFAWPAAACAACDLRDRCLSKKKHTPFRTLQVGEGHMPVQERRVLCKTPEYRTRMKRRNALEGSHSELKRGYGLRRCRYRGLPKTDIQTQFTAAACNLRRWSARLCWLARKNG